MNLEHQLKQAIAEAFKANFNHEINPADLALQPTNKEFEGNYTLVVFPFLKFSRKKPEDTAQSIGQYIQDHTDLLEKFNVVKGFLNMVISHNAWLETFKALAEDANYGALDPKDQLVVIEFSSPNTNKPLHLGHLRNNFLGFSVASILNAAGYDVVKVNLVNDRGIHICKSMLAYQKFGLNETPESAGIKGDHLIGNYYVKFDQEYKKQIESLINQGLSKEEAAKEAPLIKEAQQMLISWEKGDPEVVELWKKMNGWVYDGFEETYRRMGVAFDKIYHESETYLLGKAVVQEGLEKKLFFTKDDGSVWVDLEDEGLDQKLLLRSDGTSVYMTQDLGTADLKFQDYRCDKSIYVVGNEQDYHFEVLFTILKKLQRTYSNGLYHLSYGMVDLPSGKMKSREGTVVDADDLMDEMVETARRHTEELGKIEGFDEEQARELYETLALGALKFYLLKVDPKKRMLFNPEESIQFHGYTGPFVQYTYARISAILRKANEMGINYRDVEFKTIGQLHESEITVIQLLNGYKTMLRDASDNFSPSQVAQYVFELAKEYNRFYTEVSIFGENLETLRRFRILFSSQVAKTIESAMGLLGIKVPERM